MIYLDNSATTKIDSNVLDTYQKVSQEFFANPSSLHGLGEKANQLLKQSRQQIASYLSCQAEEIHFTSGGTEADNWAIKGTALEKRAKGKHLITTQIEHPAVKKTFQELEDYGFETTYLPVDSKGQIDMKQLKESIRPDTTLLSVIAVNNELGCVQNLDQISQLLEQYPSIHFHVDAVQALAKINLDLSPTSRIDLASFSGHKFHAPRGIGFLYKKSNRKIKALLNGGGQEFNLRSGTENTPAIASLAKAIRLLFDYTDLEKQKHHLAKIRSTLSQYEGVQIFTPAESAPHILCFGLNNIKGEVLVHAFEEREIYLSTTSACSSRQKTESSTLHAMNYPPHLAQTAVRLSLSYQNTDQEIDTFLSVFDDLYQQFSELIR